jgi:hypothetical protein
VHLNCLFPLCVGSHYTILTTLPLLLHCLGDFTTTIMPGPPFYRYRGCSSWVHCLSSAEAIRSCLVGCLVGCVWELGVGVGLETVTEDCSVG